MRRLSFQKLHLDKDATSFFRQSNTSLWSLSKKKGKEGSADNLSSTLSLSTSRNFSLSGSLAWLTVDEEDESDDNHVKSRSGSESNNSADQIAKKSTVKRGMTSLFRKKKAVTASSSSIHDNAVLECDENAYDFTSSQTLAGSFNSSVKDSIPNDEQKPIDGQQMERKFKPLQSDEPKVANNEKDDDIDSLNEGIKKKRMTFLEFLLDDAPSPPTGPVPVQEENISKMQDSAPIEPPVKQGSFKLNTSGLPKPYFVVLKTDRLVLYKDESCYVRLSFFF